MDLVERVSISRRSFIKTTGLSLISGSVLGNYGSKWALDQPISAQVNTDEEKNAPETIGLLGLLFEASKVVFALDYSNTMNHANKINYLRKHMKKSIEELAYARFSLGYFNSKFEFCFGDKLVKANERNKARAISFMYENKPQDKTMISPIVKKSLDILFPGDEHGTLIVVGDGLPTLEIPKKSLDDITAHNKKRIKIHTVYIGGFQEDEGLWYMRELAERNNASCKVVNFS
jgi:hypothetical protein